MKNRVGSNIRPFLNGWSIFLALVLFNAYQGFGQTTVATPSIVGIGIEPQSTSSFASIGKTITVYLAITNYGASPILQFATGKSDDYYPDADVSTITEVTGADTHVSCEKFGTTCKRFKFTVTDDAGFEHKADGNVLHCFVKLTFKDTAGKLTELTKSSDIKQDTYPPIDQVKITAVTGTDEQITIKWTRPSGLIKAAENTKDNVKGYVIFYWEADPKLYADRKFEVPDTCGKNGIQAITDATYNDPAIREGIKSFDCLTTCDFNGIKSNYGPLMKLEVGADKSQASLTDLVNGQQYGLIVLYKDTADLLGTAKPDEKTNPQCYSIAPRETFSFSEVYDLEYNPSMTDAYCFIATATYGSTSEHQVLTFRKFRNIFLERSQLGRYLTRFYYANSPFWAKMIADSDALRMSARALLHPFYLYATLMLKYNFLFEISIGISLFLLALLAWGFYRISRRLFGQTKQSFFFSLLLGLCLFSLLLSQNTLQAGIFDINLDKTNAKGNFSLALGFPSFFIFDSGEKITKGASIDEATQVSQLEGIIGSPSSFNLLAYERYLVTSIGKIGLGTHFGTFYDSGNSMIKTGELWTETDELTSIMMVPFGFYVSYLMDIFRTPYIVPYFNFGYQQLMFFGSKGAKGKFNGNRKSMFFTGGLWFSLDWMDTASSKMVSNFYGIESMNIMVNYKYNGIPLALEGPGNSAKFDLSYSSIEVGFCFEI